MHCCSFLQKHLINVELHSGPSADATIIRSSRASDESLEAHGAQERLRKKLRAEDRRILKGVE